MSPSSLVHCFLLLCLSLHPTYAQLGHGETCDVSDINLQCNSNIGLVCSLGRCACRPQTVYNASVPACQILVGGACTYNISDLQCVPRAECGWNDQICRCTYQYTPTANGQCAASHSALCTLDTDCNPLDLLQCIHGRCQCPQPLNHLYDWNTRKCVLGVRTSCKLEEESVPTNVRCRNGTTCKPFVNNTITGHVCQCDGGMVANNYRDGCRNGYLQSCDSFGACQWDAGLVCLQGKCLCNYSPDQVWDEAQQMCAGIKGSKCNVNRDTNTLLCLSGLECEPDVGPIFGVCAEPKLIPDEKDPEPEPDTNNATAAVTHSTFILVLLVLFNISL